MKKRLTKSRNDHWIFGVIGGIGEYLGFTDLTINVIRLAWIVIFFIGIGSPLFVYLVLALVMPKDYSGQTYQRSSYDQTWGSNSQSYTRSNPNDYGSNGRKIKEAEPVNDDNDDWSDF